MYYAIKHKPTGMYLPEVINSGRGYTYTQPASLAVRIPRLFLSQRGTEQALRAWLQGEWHVHRRRRTDLPDPFGDYDEELEIQVPRVERRAEDMDIVQIMLCDLSDLPGVRQQLASIGHTDHLLSQHATQEQQ